MLDWFGRRLREMQEVKREERGFTLIELLVVVIIIGILAAIAIPTFLSQRDNAFQAQTKSMIRNGVTNAESYATGNNGTYAGLATANITPGINQTGAVTITVAGAVPTNTEFCIQGQNTSGGGTFNYLKSRDTIAAGAC